MVQPAKFRSIEFEWDENNIDEVANHNIDTEEAEQCFFNKHQVFQNKRKTGRDYKTYKLEGKTNTGRRLLIIFYVKEKTAVRSLWGPTALIRIITGWEI